MVKTSHLWVYPLHEGYFCHWSSDIVENQSDASLIRLPRQLSLQLLISKDFFFELGKGNSRYILELIFGYTCGAFTYPIIVFGAKSQFLAYPFFWNLPCYVSCLVLFGSILVNCRYTSIFTRYLYLLNIRLWDLFPELDFMSSTSNILKMQVNLIKITHDIMILSVDIWSCFPITYWYILNVCARFWGLIQVINYGKGIKYTHYYYCLI